MASTGLLPVNSWSEGCESKIERFGERLLAIDDRLFVVASPYSDGGAGWCAVVDAETCEILQSWRGSPESYLGWSLAHGDLNGDGRSDLVLGAPGTVTGTVAGTVQVLRGGPSGWEPWVQFGERQPGERFGESVLVFDPDGDGDLDLAVGASTFTGHWTFEGTVRLYRSSGTGLGESPSWSQSGRAVGAGFGRSMASGDFDRDGAEDLLVGSPEGSWGENREGRVEIFLGGQLGGLAPFPSWSVEGGEAYAYLGLSVAVFPTQDTPAWAVGAPGSRGGRGRVDLYHGPGLPSFPSLSQLESGTGAWFGASMAPHRAAGGSAIAVGAPGTDGGAGCVHLAIWDPCHAVFGWLEPSRGTDGSFLGSAVSAAEGVLWMGAPWEQTPQGLGSVHRWTGPVTNSVAEHSRSSDESGHKPVGRREGVEGRRWTLALAPQPVGPLTRLTVLGEPPCDLRWACVGPDGRRWASGEWGTRSALSWGELWPDGGIRPRSGWLVVSDAESREVIRWVDLGG